MSRINENHFLTNSGYSNYEDTVSLPRHRWYYYKEGFSPLLVEKAIDEVGLQKNDVILDPFNGSGTSTLAASVRGFKSYGIEVNPFTAFLAETKLKSPAVKLIKENRDRLLGKIEKGAVSNLIGFSTFSRHNKLAKWLFNKSILNGFEGGWRFSNTISSHPLRQLFKLSLIVSAMENCNATRDGKCLRYRKTWKEQNFNNVSFIESLERNLDLMTEDILAQSVADRAEIINGDARKVLSSKKMLEPFKLCITSPPYLNTFDYTDIYRPELFLGKFINSQDELRKLRHKTVRSHIQIDWKRPVLNDFGSLYEQSLKYLLENKKGLMDNKIPLMAQAYFEDMFDVLSKLKHRSVKNGKLWLVVSNSAYANKEIPVDLIIGDIGGRAGWFLKEIAVLRYIKRRRTKYSPDILQLRESVVVFSANK